MVSYDDFAEFASALAQYAVAISPTLEFESQFPPWVVQMVLTAIALSFAAMLYQFAASTISTTDIAIPLSPKERVSISQLIPRGSVNVWWDIFHTFVSHRTIRPKISGTSSKSCGQQSLQRQMTSIGRFSLRSQTESNPCIVTFFVALLNECGREEMNLNEFEKLWRGRVMDRHERFRCRVCDDDRFFEVMDNTLFSEYATETAHYKKYRNDLKSQIEHMLTSDFDVRQKLWEAHISSGPIGSSGAISKKCAEQLAPNFDRETVALFRIHHALADGVSMSVALGDVCDEAEDLKDKMMAEMKKRRKNFKGLSIVERGFVLVKILYFYIFGSLKALALQFWRMATSVNPFDAVMSQSKTPRGLRATTWRTAMPVEELKIVAKSISPTATLNDIFTSCVAAALRKQLEEHKNAQARQETQLVDQKAKIEIPDFVNVVVPVHLAGGVLLPGQSLGNKIGAFVAAIPIGNRKSSGQSSASERLSGISAALKEGKSSPAPLISWRMAKFFSDYAPNSVAKLAMRKGNAAAVAVISNIRGFPFKVHWNGRPVEFLSAFLPLPPGIPIGIVLQSYAGDISFTLDADQRAVPDAEKFADWILEEYSKLKKDAGI